MLPGHTGSRAVMHCALRPDVVLCAARAAPACEGLRAQDHVEGRAALPVGATAGACAAVAHGSPGPARPVVLAPPTRPCAGYGLKQAEPLGRPETCTRRLHLVSWVPVEAVRDGTC